MRSLAIERDDSVLPLSFIFSFVVHALVLSYWFHSGSPMPLAMEHIMPTMDRHQKFSETQYFANYSPNQLVYTDVRTGADFVTSGDVQVEPAQIRDEPSRTLPLRGSSNPSPVAADPNRIYYGNQSARNIANVPSVSASGGAAPTRPAQYRAGIQIPEGPDAIVAATFDRSEQYRLGGANTEQPGGNAGTLRSGAADAAATSPTTSSPNGFRVGVISVPGPTQRLNPTTPQPGQTLDHRPYEEPSSRGPDVIDNARDLAHPPGDGPLTGPAPSGSNNHSGYGPRRAIYQPLPTYPSWAERERVQATPQFNVSVGPDGRVSRVRLAVTSGYTELDRLAEAQVRRWIYEPRPGQAEERRVVVRFVLR